METAHKSPVRDDIDRSEESGELPLNVPGESWRVEHADQIVGEKATSVTRLAAKLTKVILEGGERADAVRYLHPAPPGECWQVQQRDLWPAPGEKAAEDDERREGEMENDETVSEQRPDHRRDAPDEVSRRGNGLGVLCASGGNHTRGEYPRHALERFLEGLQTAGE